MTNLFEKFMAEKNSEWIELEKHSRYEISKSIPHVIRDKSNHKIISQSINNVGYYQITLNGKTYLMHRIIYEQIS